MTPLKLLPDQTSPLSATRASCDGMKPLIALPPRRDDPVGAVRLHSSEGMVPLIELPPKKLNEAAWPRRPSCVGRTPLIEFPIRSVSYTHLTLPTILLV